MLTSCYVALCLVMSHYVLLCRIMSKGRALNGRKWTAVVTCHVSCTVQSRLRLRVLAINRPPFSEISLLCTCRNIDHRPRYADKDQNINASGALRTAHATVTVSMECGKREARINWCIGLPKYHKYRSLGASPRLTFQARLIHNQEDVNVDRCV